MGILNGDIVWYADFEWRFVWGFYMVNLNGILHGYFEWGICMGFCKGILSGSFTWGFCIGILSQDCKLGLCIGV